MPESPTSAHEGRERPIPTRTRLELAKIIHETRVALAQQFPEEFANPGMEKYLEPRQVHFIDTPALQSAYTTLKNQKNAAGIAIPRFEERRNANVARGAKLAHAYPYDWQKDIAELALTRLTHPSANRKIHSEQFAQAWKKEVLRRLALP